MRPILIDTNAYVAFKRGERLLIEIFQQAEILGISSIVLGELLAGFECGNRTKKIEMNYMNFLVFQELNCFLLLQIQPHFIAKFILLSKEKVSLFHQMICGLQLKL